MKSISQLISQKLQRQAQQLEKLTHLVQAALPVNCKDHTKVAGIRDNQLILICDSPVWASKIRLYTHNILQTLEQHDLGQISRIQVKQAQPRRIPEPEIKKSRYLDSSSAIMIEKTAEGIDDPELQQALYHLAKNRLKK